MTALLRRKSVQILLLVIGGGFIVGSFFTNCGRAMLGAVTYSSASAEGYGLGNQAVNVSASVCPADQVPIGLDNSLNIICGPTQSTGSDQTSCPANTSLYQTKTTGLICVPNTSWDRPGAMCPVGQYLIAYTGNSIECAAPTSNVGTSTHELLCPSGQYLNGISSSGDPVCLPLSSVVPGPTVCPIGQFLFDIQGSVPDCRNKPWPPSAPLSCSDNSAIIGWQAALLLCQQTAGAPGANFNCQLGQILSTASNGAGTCTNVPDPDLSHLCPPGFDLTLMDGKFHCDPLGTGSTPQCPIGQFLTGFNNGQPVCTSLQILHLPGSCPNGSYPIGISNGKLLCAPFQNVVLPNQQYSCLPNSQVLCSVTGGIGSQTCNSQGTGFTGPCSPAACYTGYKMSQGACVQETCIPGSQTACTVSNGSGIKYCDQNGSYGPCQLQSCASGFVMVGGQCLPKICTPGSTVTCSNGPAYGVRICLGDGTQYSDCVYNSCQNGYALKGQTCVDVAPPRIVFSSIPTDPTNGKTASLIFSVIDNESGVKTTTCALDGANFAPCQSPITLNGLTNGPHAFTVTATDNAGNSATQTAKWSNLICSPVGSQASCSIPNGTGAKTCQADGTYSSCAPTSCDSGYKLVNGSCVSVKCDPGYNLVGSGCVDQAPPVINVTSAPADPTVGNSVSVQFTVTDSGSGVGSVTCQLDQAQPVSCSSPFTLNNLNPGAHTLVITALDNAGNNAYKSTSWHSMACLPGSSVGCGILNGAGQQSCLADGSGYGMCGVMNCNTGYVISNNMCLPQSVACPLPWGGTIASGASVTAYKDALVSAGSQCQSEVRTCSTSGIFSGSYTYRSCSVSAPQTQDYKIPGVYTFTVPTYQSLTVEVWGGGGGAQGCGVLYGIPVCNGGDYGGDSSFGANLIAEGGRGVNGGKGSGGSVNLTGENGNWNNWNCPGLGGGSPNGGGRDGRAPGGGGDGICFGWGVNGGGGGGYTKFVYAQGQLNPGDKIQVRVGAGGYVNGASGEVKITWQ